MFATTLRSRNGVFRPLWPRELDQFFGGLLRERDAWAGFARGYRAPQVGSWPSASLHDTGQTYELRLVVPGLQRDDFSVTLESGALTVTGERKFEVPEGFELRRRERPSARFTRTFRFPETIDPEAVSAKLDDGVLLVTLTKVAPEVPKTVEITVG